MTVHIPALPSPEEREPRPDQEPRPLPMPRLLGHGCFACGTANPQGLGMTFARLGDRVLGAVTLQRAHMGWDRIAHGGIVSTVLDEVMAYTVIALRRAFFVTQSMTVRYLRPVPLETPLRAEGTLTEETPPRSCRTAARLYGPEDRLLAEAEAEMIYLPEDRLGMVSPALREEMRELFRAMADLERGGRG